VDTIDQRSNFVGFSICVTHDSQTTERSLNLSVRRL
jgi:hypothetical protein